MLKVRQTDAPPVQGDTGEGEYDVSGIEGIEDIGEDDTGYLIERLSTYDRPTLEEFSWYDEGFNNGFGSLLMPDGTTADFWLMR